MQAPHHPKFASFTSAILLLRFMQIISLWAPILVLFLTNLIGKVIQKNTALNLPQKLASLKTLVHHKLASGLLLLSYKSYLTCASPNYWKTKGICKQT